MRRPSRGRAGLFRTWSPPSSGPQSSVAYERNQGRTLTDAIDVLRWQLQPESKVTQFRRIFWIRLVLRRRDDKIEAQCRDVRSVRELGEHGLRAIGTHARLRIQVLDVGVRKLKDHSMSKQLCIRYQRCSLSYAACEPRDAGGARGRGMCTLGESQLNIHEQ